jgi:hypothetical protein
MPLMKYIGYAQDIEVWSYQVFKQALNIK